MRTVWYMERPTISERVARRYYCNSSYKDPERLRPTPDLAPGALPTRISPPETDPSWQLPGLRQADLPLKRTPAPGREEGHG
jgi:hypothetical protein